MSYNYLAQNLSKKKNYLKHFLFIFSVGSFFFLWDIKINLFKELSISFREFFYLLFIYLLINFRDINKKFLFKFILFFLFFFIYNFILFDIDFEKLNFRRNIIALVFVSGIFLICYIYEKNIFDSFKPAFLIFTYLFTLSIFFSDIRYLHDNEIMRVCGFFNFQIINQHIFLEPSHIGMIFMPFYYYIFTVNKINFYQKIFLLVLLIFIYIFYYSVTLLFSTIICFFLILFIDIRFFLKNKLFFLSQVLILLTPIIQSNCIFKVNSAFEGLNYMNSNKFKTTKVLNLESLKKKKNDSTEVLLDTEFTTKDDFKSIFDYYDWLDLMENTLPEKKISESKKIFFDELILSTASKDGSKKLDLLISNKKKFLLTQKEKLYTQLTLLIKKEKLLTNKEILLAKKEILFTKKEILITEKEISYLALKLRPAVIKIYLLSQKPFLSVDEMNDLLIKNAIHLPISNKSKINDHTSAVLINALKIALLSIKEKPFGWGFNNYASAFNTYMLKNITPPFTELYYLNYNDASNNFIKLIVEFGFLSIFIFLNLIIFTFNKNIHISQRILLCGIIATQMARAAGYFNGGFVLCLALTFVMNYRTSKYYEK